MSAITVMIVLALVGSEAQQQVLCGSFEVKTTYNLAVLNQPQAIQG